MASQNLPAPVAIPENLTQLPWYLPSIGTRLTDGFRALLSEYANIPEELQCEHIYQARDAAFQTFPLATIGEFWFLTLGLSEHPKYTLLVERLKLASTIKRPILVDIGTCIGQDLRKLVYDGAIPEQFVGIDIFADFAEVGYSFFKDKTLMGNCFETADIFETNEQDYLNRTLGSWDVVTSSLFLHAFDLANQFKAITKMFKLVKGRGSCILGLTGADLNGQDVPVLPPLVPEGVKKSRYVHSTETLTELFKAVSESLGLEVSIETGYQEDVDSVYTQAIQTSFFATSNARILFYFVEIL
ncbi:hypothetical protein BDV96DRAFT_683827 [Lophiotrema nucula]|uniref:Uncharacterized protein n=1 Tax=Lophiotrema nucula TaxID=690887 RepID=A0A6A5ZLW5_9PLEO|nr:hypothetical protein BDV96DRAFT_683827 [Lophiotrema nucula]